MIIRKTRPPVKRSQTPGGGTVIPDYISPAQRAAMEKSFARYMKLACGHLTTREAAILYSTFAKYVKDVYCERCGEFTRLAPKPDAPEYPENPLF